MQILNSLKNKNVKRYLISSIFIIVLLSIILFVGIILMYDNNKSLILEKYNINSLEENLALEELDNQIYISIYILIAAIGIMFLINIIFFLIALNKNEIEVKSMRNYLKEMANKNYTFDLNNISESEMSNLKEEIYKIVIELKEKSENLANDRETLSNYLADISHQLRTPLMAITAMTDAIIENEENLDNDTRKFIYKISNQINQINWLVNNLLKMAQLDTKTVEMNKESVSVKGLINSIKDNMNIFLEQKNQTLDVNINEDIFIYIDKKWMTQALENIVKNCIEYSKENSRIEIMCIKNPLFTEITIHDNGKGISEEDLPKIFNKFYKGKGSSNNSFGIGLSLAKSIIESQNGDIQVKSKENEGSTFIIKIYEIK